MSQFNYDSVKDLLRCPRSHAELVFTGTALVSCDPETRLRYPIVDGFPVMLADEAVVLAPEQWSQTMADAGRSGISGQRVDQTH